MRLIDFIFQSPIAEYEKKLYAQMIGLNEEIMGVQYRKHIDSKVIESKQIHGTNK